jgi:hypothetical protein
MILVRLPGPKLCSFGSFFNSSKSVFLNICIL